MEIISNILLLPMVAVWAACSAAVLAMRSFEKILESETLAPEHREELNHTDFVA